MSPRRRRRNFVYRAVAWFCGGSVLLVLLGIVLYVLVRGFSALSLDMLRSEPSLVFGTEGLMPALVNTLLVMFAASFLGVSIGTLTALVLRYLPLRLGRVVTALLEIASGVPPVVYALLGMLVFCQWAGLQVSLLAGTLTMSVVLTFETATYLVGYLKNVDSGRRLRAAALGASPGMIVVSVIIPQTALYYISGFLQSMARVAAETIALLLTVGAGTQLADSLAGNFTQSGGTLAVMLYIHVQQRGEYDMGFAIAAVLLVLVGGCIALGNLVGANNDGSQ